MADKEDNKVVLIGDPEVGKTSIFTKFKTGEFPLELDQQTRKEADCKKSIMVGGKEVTLSLYDTAGMERYEGTVPPSYFRHAKAVIFVYAIDNKESIDNIIHWADSVTPQRLEFVGTHKGIIRFLVGNKSDLEDGREVATSRGKDTADNLDIDSENFFEISAKEGGGFDDLFQAVARKCLSVGESDRSAKGQRLQERKVEPGKCRCGS